MPAGQGPEDAERIDCGGRAVIPGLIDAHWHSTLVGVTQTQAMAADIGFIHLMAGREAGATLMRGFTTVRDTGGPAFGLQLAIDRGVLPGPRIFPSGAMISQTSGHGDFRLLNELPRVAGDLSHSELAGVAAIADGRDEVLRRTREQLMKGASQIKIMAGGGVSSLYDPLDTMQYLEEEMRAAVEAAADWGTYVCAHVYTPGGIQRALRAGVKSIEHGQLADSETIAMMRDAGAWWSIQPFLADEDANPKSDPRQQAKQLEVAEGTVRAFEEGRDAGVRMAFGTDILMNPRGAASQGRQLAKLTRFMTPLEALHMATGAAGELLALSGDRAPYDGPLGRHRGRGLGRSSGRRGRSRGRARLARRSRREPAADREGWRRHEGSSPMTRASRLVAVAVSLLALPAVAQDRNWSAQVTPYLWGAGLSGSVAPLANGPTLEFDNDLSEVLEDLDAAFFITGFARRGRLGFSGRFQRDDARRATGRFKGSVCPSRVRCRNARSRWRSGIARWLSRTGTPTFSPVSACGGWRRRPRRPSPASTRKSI